MRVLQFIALFIFVCLFLLVAIAAAASSGSAPALFDPLPAPTLPGNHDAAAAAPGQAGKSPEMPVIPCTWLSPRPSASLLPA